MPKLTPEPTTLSLDRYTAQARAWVAAAQGLADARRHLEVTPLHLLVRGLEEPGVLAVLQAARLSPLALADRALAALGRLPRGNEPAVLAPRLLDLLARAEQRAQRQGAAEVRVEDLLAALTQEVRGPTSDVLGDAGVQPGTLEAHLPAARSAERAARQGGAASGAELGAEARRATDGQLMTSDRADAPDTTALTRDLLVEARRLEDDPVLGRDGDLRRVLTVLERRHKSHPLLVGEPGIGKWAIVRALARRMASDDVPTSLVGVPLLELELTRVSLGARTRAELEARLRAALTPRAGSPQPIVVVRGLEQAVASTASAGAVAEALRVALARGSLRLLATTTPDGQRRLLDKDPLLASALTVIEVAEPSAAEALEILRGVARRYEDHHKVRITEGALEAAVTLAKRYLRERFLPASALDLLDEAAAALRVETDGLSEHAERSISRLYSVEAQLGSLAGVDDDKTRRVLAELGDEASALGPQVRALRDQIEERRGAAAAVRALARELEVTRIARDRARERGEQSRVHELEQVTLVELERRLGAAEAAARGVGGGAGEPLLGEEQVARALAVWTGVPVAKMLEAEAQKLLEMEARLEQRVIGQSEAVRALSRAVRRGRVGLRDPKRPIGSFLFLGPSGVGKTELAKALAEFLFDDPSALTRLDMSEFMEKHMAQRLLGAPPGYADSEQGGFLTEAVRHRPYSVLLFDEVEKAHQDVFNLLLQVLDDGRLTDGRGRLADFSNTVIIMTSNIGSARVLESEPSIFESDAGREALRDVLLGQLGEFFRPELINRIDEVIVFRPLRREDLRKIVDLLLGAVQRLLEPRGVRLDVDEAAKALLVEAGYEPALGARPLRRAIERQVQSPLAEQLLRGGSVEGSTLRVTARDGALCFEKG